MDSVINATTSTSSTAASVPSVASASSAVPAPTSVLGHLNPGCEWNGRYVYGATTAAGLLPTSTTPSSHSKLVDRASMYQLAEFTRLEAIFIPAPALLGHSARFTAVWLPAGTTPASEAAMRSFPGAVTYTAGGPALLATQIRVPCPLSAGINGQFRGPTTLNYQPVLWMACTSTPSLTTATTETFLIDVEFTLRLTNPAITSWAA